MDELFDVVNERDEVVGKASRAACHADPNLIHRAVHFTLIDLENKKVLLTRRSRKKSVDGGKWCFLGEHVLAGESYVKALVRGVAEELGLAAEEYEERAAKVFRLPDRTEMTKFFLVGWSGQDVAYDAGEIEEVQWFGADELLERRSSCSDMTRFWIENVDWKSICSRMED